MTSLQFIRLVPKQTLGEEKREKDPGPPRNKMRTEERLVLRLPGAPAEGIEPLTVTF